MFLQVNLGGAQVDQNGMALKGDILSSAEATTQYSSSESSSGADNLNQHDSSSHLYTGMMAAARQSDGARTGQPVRGTAVSTTYFFKMHMAFFK